MNMERIIKMEELAEAFLNASVERRNLALSIMTDAEKEVFLRYVGLYRLMTDEYFYKEARDRLSFEIFMEMRKYEH